MHRVAVCIRLLQQPQKVIENPQLIERRHCSDKFTQGLRAQGRANQRACGNDLMGKEFMTAGGPNQTTEEPGGAEWLRIRPQIGLGFEAAINRDYPVMFGTLYFFTLLGLLMKLVEDLTYVFVDPRIDFESRDS